MINVSFSVVTLIKQEELMGWHSSVVKRTRIRVFGVNFSEFLVREKEFYFEYAGSSSYRGPTVRTQEVPGSIPGFSNQR